MKKLAVKIISIYKNNSDKFWISSPFLMYSNCKYQPTCSEYTIQAVEKHGTLKGLAKGVVRILRCNPLSRGGVDLP